MKRHIDWLIRHLHVQDQITLMKAWNVSLPRGGILVFLPLMTMLADVLGFMPLAIGIGRGTDLLQPLAIAVMGGLILGTVMTLWLAPVLYVVGTRRFAGHNASNFNLDRGTSDEQ